MKLFYAVLALIVFTAIGCQQEPQKQEEAAAEQPSVESAVEAVERPDTTGASMWAHLQAADYQNSWGLWPEKGELYTGQEPHGMLLTTYLNGAAFAALHSRAGTMPDGAILVKENYMPDSTLAAVPVMYKVAGYNPEHSDWFFSKYMPDGTLATAPNGMALEGRLAGCQGCHITQAANDYLFTGSLSE